MQEENLLSLAQYAAKNKLSIYKVIQKINKGELKSIKKNNQDFIVDTQSEPIIIKKSALRRKEFSVQDESMIQEILQEISYGVLSLIAGNKPYSVPLNFATFGNDIIFHGANEGKKIELIGKGTKACFSVVKEYSFLPSYFSSSTSACPATQFFASVFCEGEISLLTDLGEKAKALGALMQKMQPEKNYEDIEVSNPIYTKMLEKTAVFKLKVDNLTTKVKAGQNLNEENKEKLITKLQERGSATDLKTIELMKRF